MSKTLSGMSGAVKKCSDAMAKCSKTLSEHRAAVKKNRAAITKCSKTLSECSGAVKKCSAAITKNRSAESKSRLRADIAERKTGAAERQIERESRCLKTTALHAMTTMQGANGSSCFPLISAILPSNSAFQSINSPPRKAPSPCGSIHSPQSLRMGYDITQFSRKNSPLQIRILTYASREYKIGA